ncbi:MAPEG family protein [Govanella unica]|uniref:MAPEG family protein n=1 Tax=Govanella unica TaxID=2975056 RepID=A0A9X3Z611_9PROT|nr:MAPEG family protein [Govania unica]MDA5192454.1 MAPEG family protein [Govania unica]
MTVAFDLTVLVSGLALLVYIWTMVLVGRARGRHGVKAPATEGPEDFQRVFRVQQNTLEQIVLFLPVLWLAYLSYMTIWPAVIGLLWPLGRVLYALSYKADPTKRGLGFMLTFLPSVALLILALVKSVLGLI